MGRAPGTCRGHGSVSDPLVLPRSHAGNGRLLPAPLAGSAPQEGTRLGIEVGMSWKAHCALSVLGKGRQFPSKGLGQMRS